MRKLLGFLLAAIGLAFGHAAYQNAPTDREDQLADVTRILTNPGVELTLPAATAVKPLGTVRPAVAVTGTVKSAQADGSLPSSPTALKTNAPAANTVVAAAVEADAQTAHNNWQTSVKVDALRPGTTAPVSSAVPGDRSARYELVRSLQTELKRLGCYSGDADGNWGGGSKRAMLVFMDRVNASLPVAQPDYIQLNLLQAQTASVCGRDCPKGQAQANDGRCVPAAILARAGARKDGDRRDAAWSEQTTLQTAAAEPESELPWAPKFGAPKFGSPKFGASKSGTPKSGESKSGTRDRNANRDQFETASVEEPSRRSLPAGRMSVGAPIPSEWPDRAERNEAPAADETASLPVTEPDSDTGLGSGPDSGPDSGIAASDPYSQTNNAALDPRTMQRFAAVTADPQPVGIPRLATPPRVRAVVPKFYGANPQRAAARPSRQRYVANYRPHRAVQALFTHPLGHM